MIRPRVVLFDAVGTLIRPQPPVAEAYQAAGQRFGSRRSQQQIRQRFQQALARQQPARGGPPRLDKQYKPAGTPGNRFHCDPTDEQTERRRWQQIVAEVFDDVPDAEGELFQTLWNHFAESRHWRLFDDVPAAWQRLESLGLTLGIASNFDHRLAGICRDLQPLCRARYLFHSAGVGYPKPSGQFFRTVQRQLDLPAQQILLVGDDPENDLHGPRAAGWQALLLDRTAPDCDHQRIASLMEVAQRIVVQLDR